MPFGDFGSYGSSSVGTGRSGDGSAGGTRGGMRDSGESNNYQGVQRRDRREEKVKQPKPPKYDFTVDIDSLLDQNQATSIADALLQQQYASAIMPFENQLARGLMTPEAFRLAQGNLEQQRGTLGSTYQQTALGELTRGKTQLQDMLQGYKTDPTSLEVGEGLDFNTALNQSLKGRADEFMGGLSDSIYGILSTQNPFQAQQAQQASLSGRGTTSSPIAAAIAQRNNENGGMQRKLGDRVI